MDEKQEINLEWPYPNGTVELASMQGHCEDTSQQIFVKVSLFLFSFKVATCFFFFVISHSLQKSL